MTEIKDKVVTVEGLNAVHDYNEDTYLKKEGALNTLGVNATAAELNILDGVTATAQEINYIDGVTSNIQTQLNGKAASSHTHPLSGVVGLLDLLMTPSTGGVKYNVTSGDMLSVIHGWSAGMHTAYFVGCTNMPKSNESFRVICHKTSNAIGWVIAFSYTGSVFTNYDDSGTWIGWKTIYDANPSPLWSTNGYYMTAGHTVTPSKKLSECQHGWIIGWSDYDKETNTTNQKDWHFDIIPKRAYNGGLWDNHLMYFDIPRYIGDNTSDIDTERRIIKQCYVSDDKIVGHNSNNLDERHDVVLRVVYEF